MNCEKLEYVTIELTKVCNFQCRFCFAASNQALQAEAPATQAQMEHIVNELDREHISKVTLTGGEPLIDRQTLFWFMKALSEHQIAININSNLSLIDDEIIDQYIRYVGADIFIFTSLLSPKRETCDFMTGITGSYDRILQGFRLCHDRGLKISVNFTLDQDNFSDLDLIQTFVREHHLDRVSISQVIPPFYDRGASVYTMLQQQMKAIANMLVQIRNDNGICVASSHPIPLCVIGDKPEYEEIEWARCRKGTKHCAVNLNTGNVFACSQEHRNYGNIYQESLHDCWRRMVPDHGLSMLKEHCQNCSLLNRCGGECRWNGSIRT